MTFPLLVLFYWLFIDVLLRILLPSSYFPLVLLTLLTFSENFIVLSAHFLLVLLILLTYGGFHGHPLIFYLFFGFYWLFTEKFIDIFIFLFYWFYWLFDENLLIYPLIFLFHWLLLKIFWQPLIFFLFFFFYFSLRILLTYPHFRLVLLTLLTFYGENYRLILSFSSCFIDFRLY